MIAKRRYKVRVLTQPTPSTATSIAPTPMVASVSTQTTKVKSTADSILVTIHKLAMEQFAEVPHPTTRSISDNSSPPEDVPSASVRQGTPWPNAGLASENLFKTRKDWPVPPTPVSTPAPNIKTNCKLQQSPTPLQCPNKPQKNSHGDCISPFAKTKKNMEKKTGMVIYKINSECAPKTLAPDCTKPSATAYPMPTATNPSAC